MDHLCGPNAVLEALRGGRPVLRLMVVREERSGRLARVLAEARRQGVPVRLTSRQDLDRLVRVRHQGVVALVGAFRPRQDPLEVLEEIRGVPLLAILEGIEDPQNLGALIRTCECAGVHAVFVPRRRSAPFSEVTARAAAGALEHVTVVEVGNVAGLLRLLQERGIWVIGLAGGTGRPLAGFDLTGPLALALGSEGRGLSRLVRERCDSLVSLPVYGRLDSLNVSVAAGVALYEVLRQRGGAPTGPMGEGGGLERPAPGREGE